jgi:hypothetical protein
MRAIRLLAFAAAPALLLVAGCDIASIGRDAKTATEERRLSTAHVPKSGLHVQTGIGAVEIVADSSVQDVQIVAKVTAAGPTDEEAKARLEKIVVKADRRADQVLEITARPAEEGQPLGGGCAFDIRIPDANGVTVRIGTGAVTLRGLTGAADIHTGTGAVTVTDHHGDIAVQTGTGAIKFEKTTGKVQAESGTGAITHTPAPDSDSPFDLAAGVGSIAVELPSTATGTIQANTSLGSIQVEGPRQPVSVTGSVTGERTSKEISLTKQGPKSTAQTGTGSITITLK